MGGLRKTEFAVKEHYHIFNRGVDKRNIFMDEEDFARFFQSMNEFNVLEPIGSIFENSFRQLGRDASKCKQNKDRLVNFVCYCLNPNHYHFILEQITDKGIEKFMHRLGTGYSKYFNKKYTRSGSLFQGPFKAVYIKKNNQLLHTSIYINLNDRIHKLGSLASKSSWGEYIGKDKSNFCKKDIILGQGLNYKREALNSLKSIRESREDRKILLE